MRRGEIRRPARAVAVLMLGLALSLMAQHGAPSPGQAADRETIEGLLASLRAVPEKGIERKLLAGTLSRAEVRRVMSNIQQVRQRMAEIGNRPMSEMSPPLAQVFEISHEPGGRLSACVRLVQHGSLGSADLESYRFRIVETRKGWRIESLTSDSSCSPKPATLQLQ